MFSISDVRAISDPVLREQIEHHPRAQDLLRAFLYPYAAPDRDFLFCGGSVTPLDTSEVGDAIAGRVPVLAVGSNRAPVQLTRKFTHQNLPDDVPVTLGWMGHHDIVYSAHVTGYGAFPATLAPSPGTRVRVAVTWLAAAQLGHMHVTESVPTHYRYQQLHGRDLDLDCGITTDHVGLYQSVAGFEFASGHIFALNAVEATGRRYPSLEQWQVVAHVARLAGQVFRPDLVIRLIDDPAFRKSFGDLDHTK